VRLEGAAAAAGLDFARGMVQRRDEPECAGRLVPSPEPLWRWARRRPPARRKRRSATAHRWPPVTDLQPGSTSSTRVPGSALSARCAAGSAGASARCSCRPRSSATTAPAVEPSPGPPQALRRQAADGLLDPPDRRWGTRVPPRQRRPTVDPRPDRRSVRARSCDRRHREPRGARRGRRLRSCCGRLRRGDAPITRPRQWKRMTRVGRLKPDASTSVGRQTR
jgi:hypothetical protein